MLSTDGDEMANIATENCVSSPLGILIGLEVFQAVVNSSPE